MCAVSVFSERSHALQLAVLSLILRENVQTNYINRTFFEVVVFVRTAMPLLSAPMLIFFPIFFYIK